MVVLSGEAVRGGMRQGQNGLFRKLIGVGKRAQRNAPTEQNATGGGKQRM